MKRIRFIPAQVKTFPDERPNARKRCGSPILAQRGTANKIGQSSAWRRSRLSAAAAPTMGAVFRQRPEGIARGGCADGPRSRGRSDCRRAGDGGGGGLGFSVNELIAQHVAGCVRAGRYRLTLRAEREREDDAISIAEIEYALGSDHLELL